MENKTLQIASDLGIESEEIEIVSINTICRLCGTHNERLIGIFSDEGVANDLSNKINLYLPVKVAASDELPLQCCWNCASTLLAWHELVVTSVETDRRFRNLQLITEKHIGEDAAFDSPVNPPSDDNADNDGSAVAPLSPLQIDIKPLLSPKREPPSRATCDICNKTISRARDLKRHKTSCHPPDPKELDQVVDLAAKKCTVCDIKFENRLKLKNHVLEEHQIKPKRYRRTKKEIVPQFFCDVCEKGFTRKHDMEKHRGGKHIEYKAEAKEEKVRKNNLAVLQKCRNRGSDGKLFYKCDFCQRIFRQSYNLMRHRMIHTGVRTYFCHLCGKSFRVSNGLKRHIEGFHHGVKNFSCEVCKKTFAARATRDEHMNIHTNNRPFVCDVCGKCFKQKASLYVHKTFHSETFRFECCHCGKKFRRNRDLKVHTWLHTGHRPHSCHKCEAAFRLRHDLTRHLRIHEKLNECVCNECGSVFTQERYLKVHKKIHKGMGTVLKVESVHIKDEFICGIKSTT